MTTDSRHSAATQTGRAPDAEIEQTVVALTHRVLEDGDLVVLGGPARNGRSAVLSELERRLPPHIHPLQVSTRSARAEDLFDQILDRLQLPTSGDPRETLRRYIERMRGEGIRPVLIVNDSYRLSNKAVLQLLSPTSDGAARMPVVLATSRYEPCLRALRRSDARVSLVRLENPTSAPSPGYDKSEVAEHEGTSPARAASRPPAPPPSAPTELPGPDEESP